jgi:hypothetical protein
VRRHGGTTAYPGGGGEGGEGDGGVRPIDERWLQTGRLERRGCRCGVVVFGPELSGWWRGDRGVGEAVGATRSGRGHARSGQRLNGTARGGHVEMAH